MSLNVSNLVSSLSLASSQGSLTHGVYPSDFGFDPEIFPSYRPGQLETATMIADHLTSHSGFAVAGLCAPPGCISGETLIQIGRGTGVRASYRVLISEEYRKQEHSPRRDRSLKSYTRSFTGEFIEAQPVHSVSCSGVRSTLELTLENSQYLRATPDHRILTTNGWVRLEALSKRSKVIIDIGIPEKGSSQGSRKKDYFHTQGLRYHPFSRRDFSNRIAKRCLRPEGLRYRVAYHRLVMEAKLNNISTEDLIRICRTEPLIAEGLIYLDPKEFAVHHLDGDHRNNNIDNLQVLTHAEHARVHDPVRYLRNVVSESRVRSVASFGSEDTYDLTCDGPHPNFVANGIVVHNSGKSVIYETVRVLMEASSLTCTISKGLQTQLQNDFGYSGMFSIVGHSNYSCARSSRSDTGELEDFECDGRQRNSKCYYQEAIDTCLQRPSVVTNTAHRVTISKGANPERLGRFGLLVLDEAHLVRDNLCGLLAVSIPARKVSWALHRNLPPADATLSVWEGWCQEALAEISRRKLKPGDWLLYLARELERFLDGLQLDDRWIALPQEWGVKLQPIWAEKFTRPYLFYGIDKVLLVSATITKEVAEQLGVDVSPSNSAFRMFDMGSVFPPERRPFIFLPTIEVRYDNSEAEQAMLFKRVDDLLAARQDRRSLIHTISYALADKTGLWSRFRDQIITHKSGGLRSAMERFLSTPPPTTLASPVIKEGYDFKDDKARFQIILKIARLDSRDSLTKARKATNKRYELIELVFTILQMYGRIVRSASDWGETVILDTFFRTIPLSMFPAYFQRAYKRVSELPMPLKF